MFFSNRIFHSSIALVYNIFLSGISFFLLIALFSNNPNDPSLNVATSKVPSNIFGIFGSYSSDFLIQNFGITSYIIPFLILGRAFIFSKEIRKFSLIGLALIFLSLISLSSIFTDFKPPFESSFNSYGGFLGMILNSVFLSFFKNYVLFWKFSVFIIILFITIIYNFENTSCFFLEKINLIKKKINFLKNSKKFSSINPRGKNDLSKKNSHHMEEKKTSKENSLQGSSDQISSKISNFIQKIKEKIANFKKNRKKAFIKKQIHTDHYTKPNILNSSYQRSSFFPSSKPNQSEFSFINNRSEKKQFSEKIKDISLEKNFSSTQLNNHLIHANNSSQVQTEINHPQINQNFKTNENLIEKQALEIQDKNSLFKSDFFKNNGSFFGANDLEKNHFDDANENFSENHQEPESFYPQDMQSFENDQTEDNNFFQSQEEIFLEQKTNQNQSNNRQISENIFGLKNDFKENEYFQNNQNENEEENEKIIQEYKNPDLCLLQDKSIENYQEIDHEAIRILSEKLIKVLEDFSIFGKIIDYFVGPVITLFEFEPLPGTKSSRVIGLSDDIARSLSAVSTRISVIPGKNALGIEIPNKTREIVLLKELLVTEEYQDANFSLPIALGKNIAGLPVIVDLSRMPHALVAGTTGSGKSVAINIFILSILFKLKPEECRFIMIDPKMLELSVYNGIPHLLTPVVTDPKKAVLVLKWVVKEMENRYKMMSYLGVRNIQNYNQKIDEAIASGTELFKMINLGFDKGRGEPITEKIIIEKKKFHYIVVIVDEMADLMLVAGKELEFYVQRIAQMARAAGIHIIMATQRPSVDVITGVIKANLPTRISFAVTNKIDSRTILGEQGAEQLLGMGDMLYMPSGGKIIRVHGPFVSDKTVEDVVNYLHSISSPQYIPEILEEIENNSLNLDKNGSVNSSLYDDSDSSVDKEEVLYRQALNIVLNEKKTSISYIQRQLRIGYNKSANLIERMEKEGFLSQPNHQGKREILKNE